MEPTGTEEEIIDLSHDAGEDDVATLRRRLAELEEALADARADVGRLQLQVELFTQTDPVTGFVNHAGTVDAIQIGLERLARRGEPFTVLLIDLSASADRAGRPEDAGDELDDVDELRHLGALIGGGLRRLDRVGRFDGRRFVTVLADLGTEHLGVVTDRLHHALEVDLGAGVARSAAVVVAEPVEDDPDDLLALAASLLDEGAERAAITR